MQAQIVRKACCLLAAALAVANPPAAQAVETTRESLTASGAQAAGNSLRSALSADGRFLAFESDAPGLVPSDTRTSTDIFVRDRQTGTLARVSVSSTGEEAKGDSFAPTMSADGRFVAFESVAWNLVRADGNNAADVFVHDRVSGATTRVSIASDGAEGNGTSFAPAISADGRYVAFQSEASNLVPDDGNGAQDVFVADRVTGQVSRVSRALGGGDADGPSMHATISGDGRYVAFVSDATNLTESPVLAASSIYVVDRNTGETKLLASGAAESPSLSGDGRWIAFAADGYVFVGDRVTGRREQIDQRRRSAHCGRPGDRFSCWRDDARSGRDPKISFDGRYVAFESRSQRLVYDNPYHGPQIYVADRETGEITRVSVNDVGTAGDKCSSSAAISADGALVSYKSTSTNLVAGDSNQASDVFVAAQACRTAGRVPVRGGAADDASRPRRAARCRWSP